MTTGDISILKPEFDEKLYEYQQNRMRQLYQEYVDLNQATNERIIKYCPKCGIENPETTKGGNANSGKPMLKCCSCGKRFVYDNGTLTFYSHQDESKWADFIKETMSGTSMEECAALIDVTTRTAFRMRHKLMSFLAEAAKEDLEKDPLSNEVECDETYYHECHKGLKDKALADVEDKIYWHENYPCTSDVSVEAAVNQIETLQKERDEIIAKQNKKKRGISSDLACVVTSVERQGDAVIMATNMAKPSSDDIRKATAVIEDGSFVFIDGATAYLSVLAEKNCNFSICPSDEKYDAVNHLNNVNSLHSKMGDWMRKYRGVSTIYLNRYAALFHYVHKFRDCDKQEMALLILKRLNSIQHYFFDRMMHINGIFADPQVMKHRATKVSIWEQRSARRQMRSELSQISVFA